MEVLLIKLMNETELSTMTCGGDILNHMKSKKQSNDERQLSITAGKSSCTPSDPR